jgi:hypothetical protein
VARTEEGMCEIVATEEAVDAVVASAYHKFGLYMPARARVSIGCCCGSCGDTDAVALGAADTGKAWMSFWELG